MNKIVSILVPVYNRESIIAETLESALSQTYRNIEVIVVDNASTDNTWDVIQQVANTDSRIKAFRNESNIGPVRNWLRCVEKASGEYGKILWSDDLISPDFLEKCLPLLDDETAFVYSSVKIFTNEPEKGRICYSMGATGHKPSYEYLKKALLGGDVPVSPGCALFRMQDIRKNLHLQIENKVNSDFSMHAIGNDLLLFLLTAKDYSRFGFVSEPLAFFRSHADSITISSKDGKIPLHYMLAKAYYVERYKVDWLPKLVAKTWLLLKKHPTHIKYGIKNYKDFYSAEVRLSYLYASALVCVAFFRLPGRVLKKLTC